MKKKCKIIFSCIMTFLLFIICLCALSSLVERKDSRNKYMDFFTEKENFDVLFLGSSHVINGIYPMELWNDYGIVSYNMGGHGNRMPTNYIVLKEALNYTTPKLVVIDCFHVKSDRMYSDSIEQVHLSLDAFPLTLQKIQGIHELINDPSLEAEFLWDFVTYHNRWDSLTKDDFSPIPSVEKGAEMRAGVATPNEVIRISPDEKLKEDTNGIIYLRKIIELCQKNDIDVLLTYLPFPSLPEDQAEANRLFDIAEEYDVQYLNFLTMENIVNYDTDCLDEGSHLNVSGGNKMTDYIGQYISDQYNIPDHRSDSSYDHWNTDYQEYTEYKLSLLRKENSLYSYLMFLSDDQFTFHMNVNTSSDVLNDTRIQHLLHSLNNRYSLSPMDEDISVFIEVLYHDQIIDTARFNGAERMFE